MSIRKKYVKPQLERVQLALEEAVLGGCKASSVGQGPFAPGSDCQGGGAQCFWIQS